MMKINKVPFVDLYAQYQSIKDDIDKAIANTIQNSAYIGGKAVKDFEDAFASYLGIKEVVACANGTDSIEILLKSFRVGPGDEVIVPAISWISTSEAVSAVGAKPVFVDIDPKSFCIDVNRIEKAISKNTKAIIPVHLYGHPADMNRIMAIAREHKLLVIEDCAQSHGATIGGKMVGTFGDAASFSFYPGKNLGAYGDAGCMASQNAEIASVARMIANHGQKGKHNHIIEGRNSRLDGLQAAILSAKLPYLKQWTENRISNASKYTKLLGEVDDVETPETLQGAKHVFHLYVIRSKNRNALQQLLNQAGVETAIHYPLALPFLPCYKSYNLAIEDFPVAYEYQSTILSIPMFPELSDDQIDLVVNCIRSFSA